MVFSTGAGADLQNKQAMGKVAGPQFVSQKATFSVGQANQLYCLQMRRSHHTRRATSIACCRIVDIGL